VAPDNFADFSPELKARAVASITAILARNRGGAVVAVCHGGPIRGFLAASLLGMPDDAAFNLAVDHGAVTLVERSGDRPTLRFLNLPGRGTCAGAGVKLCLEVCTW
jgi:broad specificity phosphatase PhoE